jgi:hypothetical protein
MTRNTSHDIVSALTMADSSSPIDNKHYYIYSTKDNSSAYDPGNNYDAHSSPPRYYLGKNATLIINIFLGHPYLNCSLPKNSSCEIMFIPPGGGSCSDRLLLDVPNYQDTTRFIQLK